MRHYCELYSGSGSLIRQTFASLNASDDYIFTYLQGFNDNIIFPGKVFILRANKINASFVYRWDHPGWNHTEYHPYI